MDKEDWKWIAITGIVLGFFIGFVIGGSIYTISYGTKRQQLDLLLEMVIIVKVAMA